MKTKTQKVENVVRVTTTKKAIQVSENGIKTTYLNEGVTGKQVMKSIFEANNKHKLDLGSYSQCMKRAIEFGKDELSKTIKGFNVKDLTPNNIIPLRNAKKTSENAWSVYEVLMLIKKYYQTKK